MLNIRKLLRKLLSCTAVIAILHTQTSGPVRVPSPHLSCTLSVYVQISSSMIRNFALKDLLIAYSSMTEGMQLQEARQIRGWRL